MSTTGGHDDRLSTRDEPITSTSHVRHEDRGVRTSGVADGAHAVDVNDRHGNDGDFAAQRDRVRWGPLWAGVVITIATFLLMQLGIFSAGLFEGGDAGTWLTAAAALVAFFLGGLTVGATALWRKASDGILNGIVMWAFATVSLLVLTLIGGGTLLGPVSTVAADLVQIQNVNLQDVPAADVDQALDGARDAAGWALLGLVLALVSAAIGGAAGAKMWPRRDTAGTTARDAEGVR